MLGRVCWPLLAAAVALSAAACDGNALDGMDRGGPFSNTKGDASADGASAPVDGSMDRGADVVAAKDGAADAKVDVAVDAKVDVPVGTGGTGGTMGGSGGTSGGAGSGSGGTAPQTCDECEAANCGAVNMVPNYRAACHDPKDSAGMPAKASAGPAAGTSKKVLCEAVLSCVRQNPDKCVTWVVERDGFEGVSGCYCGKTTSDDDCQSGKANGPCKAAIESAAEIGSPSSSGPDVAQRFVDWESYALGAAVNIVQECDAVFCRNSCLGLPGPNSLKASAGTGGTGGNTGGGGRTGSTGGMMGAASGGVTGSGGVPVSNGTGGAGGGPGGGTAVTYNMCRACEQSMCPEALSGCEQLSGTAEAGPKMGTPRKDLCKAVVACARAKRCPVEGDATACYCGTADVDGACMSGGANGPCKVEIEAAAESVDFKDIGPRFVNGDPTMKLPYAIAAATDLLGCDGFFCADARCVVGDPAAVATGGNGGMTGSGGRPATGGMPGNGGMSGTGGRSATGGMPASGGMMGTGGVPASGGAPGGGGTGGTGGVPAASTLQNGTFDTGAASWAAGFAATVAWTATRDAAGNSGSGALGVTNINVVDTDGSTMTGALQCVRVTPRASYSLGGQAFIPAGQSVASAGVNISFYPSADCTGTVNGGFTSPLVSTTNVWSSVGSSTTAPAAAQSALVQLVVLKTFRAAAVQAYFDALSFRSP